MCIMYLPHAVVVSFGFRFSFQFIYFFLWFSVLPFPAATAARIIKLSFLFRNGGVFHVVLSFKRRDVSIRWTEYYTEITSSSVEVVVVVVKKRILFFWNEIVCTHVFVGR